MAKGSRTKMFTAERVGFLILIATVMIFAIIAMVRRCSRETTPVIAPQQSVIDTLLSDTPRDTIHPGKKAKKKKSSTDSTKTKKSKKKKAATATKSFERSHLDETAN